DVDEIAEKLDRHTVVPRDGAQLIAAHAWGHYDRLGRERSADNTSSTEKSAILLVGPSHSSNVFLCRILAHLFGVPFAHGDVLALSPSASQDSIREPLFFKLL